MDGKDELCGMNGMDWSCGMGGRDGIDEMCVMDGMNGMDGRCTTFTPPNNRLVITLCTHKIPSVPLSRHRFRWDSLNNLYKFRRLFPRRVGMVAMDEIDRMERMDEICEMCGMY